MGLDGTRQAQSLQSGVMLFSLSSPFRGAWKIKIPGKSCNSRYMTNHRRFYRLISHLTSI